MHCTARPDRACRGALRDQARCRRRICGLERICLRMLVETTCWPAGACDGLLRQDEDRVGQGFVARSALPRSVATRALSWAQQRGSRSPAARSLRISESCSTVHWPGRRDPEAECARDRKRCGSARSAAAAAIRGRQSSDVAPPWPFASSYLSARTSFSKSLKPTSPRSRRAC